MNYIDRNPMKNVIMPKIKKLDQIILGLWRNYIISFDIVKETEPFKHFALFRLFAFSGLRKGELYALKWADINFDSNLLNIDKSLGRIDGKGLKRAQRMNLQFVQSILMMRQSILLSNGEISI